MAKSPSDGKRPVPTVAKGKSPSFDNSSMGSYGGSKNTKVPHGNRPVPTVPRDEPPAATVPGPTKAPIRRTPMPTPKRDATTGASKANGGGSY